MTPAKVSSTLEELKNRYLREECSFIFMALSVKMGGEELRYEQTSVNRIRLKCIDDVAGVFI